MTEVDNMISSYCLKGKNIKAGVRLEKEQGTDVRKIKSKEYIELLVS